MLNVNYENLWCSVLRVMRAAPPNKSLERTREG